MRRLGPGQVAALFAAEIHLVVIAFLALELTGSGLALGTVLGVGLLPRIVFTLVGGVAADRWGHRSVLAWCNVARAVIVGVLAVATLVGTVQVWQLYAVGLVLGSITSFYSPALFAAVPRECPAEDLRAGNALMRGTAEAVGVTGPVAGGVLVTLVGTGAAMATTATLYAVGAVSVGLLLRASDGSPAAGPASAPSAQADPTIGRRSILHDLTQGFAALGQDTFLCRVLVLIGLAGIALSGPITVGVPWLAREEFGAPPMALGLMLAAWAAGSLLGIAAAGTTKELPPWRALMSVLAIVITIGMATLAVHPGVVVVAVCLLVMGAVAGAFNIVLITWLQERTRPDRLGRLMSLAELAELVVSPASYLLAGVLLDVSVTAMFLGAAAVFLVGVAVVILPGHRSTGSLPTAPADARATVQSSRTSSPSSAER
jgi:MFS family permease